MYAPLYRQVTGYGYEYNGTTQLAYSDVLAAWRDYLAHYNHGRGVVLIGHSQGADLLTELIQKQIDRNAAERKLLVSAILLGGDVTVKQGSFIGGSFHHVPACTSPTETACVVAYEAWDHRRPANRSSRSTTARSTCASTRRRSAAARRRSRRSSPGSTRRGSSRT